MLSVTDVTTDHAAYAERRDADRARVIPLRRTRRVRLGDTLALAFENAETLAYQVQEMVFAERLTDPDAVAHEIDLYGRMLPGSHHLCATLFLELDDQSTIREDLTRLDGVQHALTISVGEHTAGGVELPGPDEPPGQPTPTVSVHVVRFEFDDAARDAFRDPEVPAQVVVDHPQYRESTPISGETRRSLLADLRLTGS